LLLRSFRSSDERRNNRQSGDDKDKMGFFGIHNHCCPVQRWVESLKVKNGKGFRVNGDVDFKCKTEFRAYSALIKLLALVLL
jgi:hypothetical protein